METERAGSWGQSAPRLLGMFSSHALLCTQPTSSKAQPSADSSTFCFLSPLNSDCSVYNLLLFVIHFKRYRRTSLVVQWLGLCISNAGGTDWSMVRALALGHGQKVYTHTHTYIKVKGFGLPTHIQTLCWVCPEDIISNFQTWSFPCLAWCPPQMTRLRNILWIFF